MADFPIWNLTNDPSKPVKFDLYKIHNHEATRGSGGFVAYGRREDDAARFETRQSGYSVTVNPILWVDGWEKTTFEGANPIHHQEMTLMVFRISLAPNDHRRTFKTADITLAFEDGDENTVTHENKPRVEAWAPFNSIRGDNTSKASCTKCDKMGVNLSGSRSNEHEISWDRTTFDEGSSYPSGFSRREKITWNLAQIKVQNTDIQHTFDIAVLISRPTREHYLVKFDIEARIGTIQDFENKTKLFFGSKPARTKPYLVTPWKQQVCNGEGRDMMKGVDLDNLGRLRNKTKCSRLQLSWEPSHQVPVDSSAAVKQAEESLGNSQAVEKTQDGFAEEAMPASLKTPGGTHTETPLSSLSRSTASSLSGSSVDLARLTALETRVAQLEARLASQDQVMLRFKQAFAGSI